MKGKKKKAKYGVGKKAMERIMELKELWKTEENKGKKEWMKVCWFLQHTFNTLLYRKQGTKLKHTKRGMEWKEGQRADNMKGKKTENKAKRMES